MQFLAKYHEPFYSLMRAVLGFTFLWHGVAKLFGYPEPLPPGSPAFVVWVGGTIELVTGVLIMIGLLTRPAAFLASGTMAAAYWMAHGTKALLPYSNGGELAVVYCFVFLFMSAHGSGRYSVDWARGTAGRH